MTYEPTPDRFYQEHGVDPTSAYDKALLLGREILRITEGNIFDIPATKEGIDKFVKEKSGELENLAHDLDIVFQGLKQQLVRVDN